MATTTATFEDILFQMQTYKDSDGYSYPRNVNLLPSKNATICNVDLNTRKIDAPTILSVQYDHNAEVIYFKCARYFDNIDLANMICVIEYINANGDAGLYWVPYIDTNHYETTVDSNGNEYEAPMIYLPWSINGLASAYSGQVTYAIRFYKLNSTGSAYMYSLSTQPATGQILHGLDLTDDDTLKVFKIDTDIVHQIYEDLAIGVESAITYWTDL